MTKCILCFGDSLTWGFNPEDGTRFPPEDRWPRALESALQGRATVIEEGLNGRTIATEEPSRPNRNGLTAARNPHAARCRRLHAWNKR